MKKGLLILSVCLLSVGAEAQGLRVLQQNVPQEVPFAKPFTAQIILSHPQGESVRLDEKSLSPDFSLTDAQLHPIAADTTQADLTLFPFVLQKSTFTASFALATEPGITTQVSIPITVTPVKLFNDKELREIRPPQRLFDWALLLCILLAIFAIICLIIFWVRRAKRDAVTSLGTVVDNRPPHVIALSQIDALVDSGLWENKQYKLFYITLTDILRTYLQRAFGLDVSADTSAELLRHMKTVAPLAPLTQTVRTFLTSGDLVKFAKMIPSEQTRNQDVNLLRELITQTAPKPPQEKPGEVKS
ncbi:MAG: hypothetical protein J6X06_05520 [Elusimicrobiaceae bacterium]|nr:hypothetical protein [Elusimicrobiaceae bacterium]